MRGALGSIAAKAAVARDPEDESAIYQELMAYRRSGNKDQMNELAAKLKEVKEHHRQAGMNYQLEEISKPTSPWESRKPTKQIQEFQ